MFQSVDPVASTTLKSYEHRQLLHRARRYVYIKGAVNAVIVLLFLLTFPPELRLRMAAIALADALLLVPYWFLLQRYPILATGLSLCITSLAVSAGDWVGGHQTGASGILYALLILGGHLVLLKPLSTYLLSALVIAIYVGTITLEVNGVIPINFPFTMSNLWRVVTLNVISMLGLTILTGMVTRLYRELLQRNKELFALNAISAAASQSLDLDEVLQLALDRVLEMMELEGGGLYLLEASTGELVLKGHRNLAKEPVEWTSKIEAEIGRGPDSSFRTGQVLAVDDLSQYPEISEIVGDGDGHHPLAVVPLKVEDRVVGVMNLLGRTGRPFTSQDVGLLNTVGAQIGLAIEHARLYYMEQDRRQTAESLRAIMAVIGSTLDLDEVLRLALEQLRKVVDYDTSSIMMLEGDELQVIAFAGFTDPEQVPKRSYTVKEAGLPREAIRKKQALVVRDVTKYPRWMYEPQSADVRAWIGAPLIAKGEVIGVLMVDSYQVGKYSQDDAQLVMTFARQAALAVKNAQLLRETQKRFEKTIALYQTSLDIPERKRAEEMLRIKSHTIESAITGIAIAEFGGNLTYVNPKFVKMWGYDDENEVLGKPAVDFWQSKEKAQEVMETLRGEGNFIGELVAKRKDGSLFDVQLSTSMVTDQTGQPICMMASFVDITERKRAEEALRASEERFRTITERAFDTIFLFDLEEGRIIYASPAVERLTHHRPEELVGEPFQNYLPESDIPKAAQALAKILKGEDIDGLQLEVLRKDGTLASIELNASAIFRGEEVIGLGSARDITERKRAEEALRESEERYRGLVESARDVIYTVSMEGTLTSLNPAFETITGWSRSEWIGKPLPSIIHPDDWPLALEMFQRMLDGEMPPLHEVRFLSKSGEYLVGEFMMTPHIQHGTIVGILGIGRDITERKRSAHLAVVNQVARRAASILDIDQLLQEVVIAIQQGFNYHNVLLAMLDETTDELEVQAVAGGFEDLVAPDYRQAVGVGMIGWAAATGQPLLSNDVSQDPHYVLGLAQEPLTKSELCVPLRLADQVIGVLDIQDTQLNAFDQTDLLAMETLADQIAVAIENARIYQEERKRATQLELIGEITQKIASILDLDELLPQVSRMIGETFGYYHTSILLVEADSDELVLRASVGSLGDTLVDRLRLKIGQEGITGWVAHSGEPLLVNDISHEPRHYLVEDSKHTGSELAVPIKLKEEIIGVLDVQAAEINAFSQDDVAMLQTLADQLAIAIQNAQLYQQTDEQLQIRVRELSALYAIVETINHSTDMGAILRLALDSAVELKGMDVGGILLLDPSTNKLLLRAHRGGSPEFIKAVSRAEVDEGLMPRMLNSVLAINDLSEVTKDRRMAIEKEGLRSLVSIPLKAMGNPLGVMVMASPSPRTFVSQTLDLLAAIGNQVGVAVDRANLQAEELRAAVLEERQHMAQQMHDDIAQRLSYLGLQIDSVMDSPSLAQDVGVQDELEGIRKAIEDAYENVRSSIRRLEEDVQSHLDLGAALPEVISQFEEQTRCRVALEVDESQLSCLPPSAAFQATYIIREALTNVRKHAGADSVLLTIQGPEDGGVEVTIQDNGRGFDLDSVQQSGAGGFGLHFMRERAKRAGGSLRVESEPGQGTRVVISLPSG